MLKRIIFALIAMVSAAVCFAAQLTATLQSGEKVTPFYGDSAFVKAYEAAVDGDIITLSPGSFKTTDVKKSISLNGSYGFGDDDSKRSYMKSVNIYADNVKIEGIHFYELYIYATENLSISRSTLYNLYDKVNGDKKYHNNTTLTDCFIYAHIAMAYSKNAVMRNCCINYFYNYCNEADNLALIENCNSPEFAYYASSLSSSFRQPYAIYRNCMLGLYKSKYYSNTPIISFNSPSEFHNVYFYKNYESSKGSDVSKDWSISFGSCITSGVVNLSSASTYSTNDYYRWSSFSPTTHEGVTYGPVNHKEIPAMPQITASEIDTETDAEGKIHVKITATAND